MCIFLAGFTITTWAPMIPVIKERLQIGDNILGLLLLCIGVSAFVFMPIAGILNQKLGCKKMLQINIILFALILIIISSLNNIWSLVIFFIVIWFYYGNNRCYNEYKFRNSGKIIEKTYYV